MKLTLKELWPVILIYAALAIISMEASAESIEYKDLQVILEVSKEFKLQPDKLLRIAYVESRFNHNAIRQNKNGTIDVGMMQINSVHWTTTCKAFDILKLKGNVQCAAKLLSMHKLKASTDMYWIGRYSSKTPSIKFKYYQKLQAVPPIKVVYND